MGKLIIFQGLPGSGKSTEARKLLAEHPDWVQVELDLIRDELGISRQIYDGAAEKRIRLIRDERILEALRAGKTVLCSDTNLNYNTLKRLQSLAAQAHVEVEYMDFTHVPVEICIERDRHRPHPVGEDVLYKMYAKIRPDDEIRSDRKHLVIGDVHGDYERLLRVLSMFGIYQVSSTAYYTGEWVNKDNLFVVFLGDLNDPRLEDDELNRRSMSSWKCLNIARGLQKQGHAEVLRSNHQLNLINLYYGRRKSLSHGLAHTKEEMEQLTFEFAYGIINWLEARPYFYSFVERGQLYTCTHACYTEGMSQYHPRGGEIEDALYGPKTSEKERLEWWHISDFYQNDRILIAGHYHEHGFFPNQQEPKAILLDGECGNTGGELLAYLPSENRIISSDDWS